MPKTVTRTVRIPIRTLSASKAGRLNWAMKRYREVRQFACDYFRESDPLDVTRNEVARLYEVIKDEMDCPLLTGDITSGVMIVRQNYQEYARGRATSPPDAKRADMFGFGQHTGRLFYTDGTYYLNIETGKGRISLPLIVSDSDYHQSVLPHTDSIPDRQTKYQRAPGTMIYDLESEDFPGDVVSYGTSTIHKTRERQFVLHLKYSTEVPEPPDVESVRYAVGVDRGRNQLAYAALYDRDDDHVAQWWNRNGDELGHYMDEYAKRVRELQQAGVYSEMDAVRERRFRYKNQVDYEIANSIVQIAEGADEDAAIVLESLAGMSNLGGYSLENRRFSEWSYYRQQRYIMDKAEMAGVPVVSVDPRHTSQNCSRCGSGDTARSSIYFRCRDCGYEQHADANAAVNIAKRINQ